LKVKKLFSAPLSAHIGDQHLQKFFRFSMEYLMEENLLGQSGKTIGLAGLAAHLWWSEPANLLLISLIQRSVLHQICKDDKMTAEQKKKKLLIVLSTVFNPIGIHPSMNQHIKRNKTASKIVLETPPDYVVNAITAHNNTVIRTFLNTRRSIERNKKTEATLPLSKVTSYLYCYPLNLLTGQNNRHSYFSFFLSLSSLRNYYIIKLRP
jgi:hypothetical protein